jgi:hypothetical protein
MTDYVLEALRERHPGRRITARQWVDANGIDVAEYIYAELLAEVSNNAPLARLMF